MIEIYGIELRQLPDRIGIRKVLDASLYSSWKARHRNIRDERTARASLAGFLILQMCGYTGEILYSESGRPYFADIDIDFNITHNEYAVFCAIETPKIVSEEKEKPVDLGSYRYPSKTAPLREQKKLFSDQPRVGIDAEDIGRISHVRICPMAERWFSENEKEFFSHDPSDLSFLRVWTHKEALIKLTGEGLRSLQCADTVLAPSLYGVHFFEYMADTTLVTLCCRCDTSPPRDIHMFSKSELLDFGISFSGCDLLENKNEKPEKSHLQKKRRML